ncbi:MAG TPA: helix-turn-helix domain-containing protein [Sphingomonas sp.]|nr:helix-turn-helix domain-containing protein [Sphingomonas sp.]
MISGDFMAGDADAGIRYWRPDEALAGLVSGYHCYWVRPPAGQVHHDVFYPGWSNLRFQFYSDGDWRVRIGENRFDPVPRASLFGPTSRAIYSESGAGLLVGAGLTPLGWSRLTALAAESVADRVVPLDTILGAEAGRLHAALAEGEDAVKRVFDAWFREHLREPRRGDDRIVALHALLTDAEPGGVAEAAARIGVHPRHLSRLVRKSFGFTPKLLLRRARFLRSLLALRDGPRGEWATLIGRDYADHSHFIRESHEFLGMAPGRFFALKKPLNDASTVLRRNVLGASAQALYRPEEGDGAAPSG